MKKTLVTLLALVFVLGIATTAFAAAAANPFVDVPAKHWAYGAVSKLAKAGVVDGYGDGTFRGDKTMTRYEMAQIVAKAMAKSDKADAELKALVDKLAVEFAAELNNLGVRVAKLEANASSIKFSGDARVRWYTKNTATHATNFTHRFGLNMTSNVNENTSFFGAIRMAQTEQGAQEVVRMNNFAMTTKDVFGTGATFTMGRYSEKLGQTGYLVGTTGMTDGAKLEFKVDTGSLMFGYADFNESLGDNTVTNIHKALYAGFVYPTSKATTFTAAYLDEVRATAAGSSAKAYKLFDIGFMSKLNSDFAFTYEYIKNDITNATVNGKPDGYIARVSYKGANMKVQGTWGAWLEYTRYEAGLTPGNGDFATYNSCNAANNKKQWDVMVNYTLAKNITLTGWQTFQAKTISTGANAANYSRLQVDYVF